MALVMSSISWDKCILLVKLLKMDGYDILIHEKLLIFLLVEMILRSSDGVQRMVMHI